MHPLECHPIIYTQRNSFESGANVQLAVYPAAATREAHSSQKKPNNHTAWSRVEQPSRSQKKNGFWLIWIGQTENVLSLES